MRNYGEITVRMPSSGRRSKLEVYVDILEAIAKGNEKPTRIMFNSNTSWLVLQDALDFLLSSGFITEEFDKRRRAYRLTEKGYKVLNDYLKIRGELVLDTESDNDRPREDLDFVNVKLTP